MLIESDFLYRVGLWSADISNLGEWTPLTRGVRWFRDVSVAADGRTAAATHGERRSGIWLADAQERDAQPVVKESAAAAAYPLVDDAGNVTYTAETTDGLWGIYRLSASASQPVLLAGKVAWGSFGTGPDGQIVLTAGELPFSLLRANGDGSGLTTLVAENAFVPSVESGGRAVLFSRQGEDGLFVVSLQGGTPSKLLDRAASGAQFSPDGRRLMVNIDKPRTLLICDWPACSGQREFTLKSGSKATAHWSPDGRGVAFINSADHRNIWVQPFDGTPSYPVTHLEDGQIEEFSWSPDGKRLVMARGRFVDDVVLLKGLR